LTVVKVMVLSLSVKETDPAASVRAQPSGTFTSRLPAVNWYGTKTVSSGMSPGGGDSVSAGGGFPCWPATGAAGEVTLGLGGLELQAAMMSPVAASKASQPAGRAVKGFSMTSKL
jgi:hypothetical protein